MNKLIGSKKKKKREALTKFYTLNFFPFFEKNLELHMISSFFLNLNDRLLASKNIEKLLTLLFSLFAFHILF